MGVSGVKATFVDGEGMTWHLDSDTVIVSGGLAPRSNITSKFDKLAPKVYRVGDCITVGRIWDAFHTAWRAVLDF